ncbi:unnamed protein product [Adineta ricciae]|uniref:Uncharacterized protein n=1 Tax=Adineta ricciae TaxID=249248 RepID=A0A816HPY7_ADIRI|nr:unnamed protein product [Adineta ricciae]
MVHYVNSRSQRLTNSDAGVCEHLLDRMERKSSTSVLRMRSARGPQMHEFRVCYGYYFQVQKDVSVLVTLWYAIAAL